MTAELISRLTASSVSEFSSEEFLLSGGIASNKAPAPDTIAASYAVFDARLLAIGASRTDAQLGRVDIFLYPRSLLIEGLSRMEIASRRRQRGAGRRLIQALAATAPNCQLNIYDIRPAALDFWIALGCSFRLRPGGWDASYALPAGLRPLPSAQVDRAEAMLRA